MPTPLTYMLVVAPTVVLVEDHLTYRQSFQLALAALSEFKVVGETANSREACQLVESKSPDLTVIDFLLPDTDGISLIRELKRRRLRTRTLILGRVAHPLFVRDALKAGANGYALKREPLENIIGAMRRVAAGESYLSPELEVALASEPLERANTLSLLSGREREIFFLLIEGLSSKEIARSLFLSPKTVDAHRLHINRKLGVRSPAELTRLVADQGLITA